MTKLLARVVAVGTFLVPALGSGTAAAQAPAPGRVGPATSPPLSPYLNLLRRGNTAGLNYYGLVRPERELYNNTQVLQRPGIKLHRFVRQYPFAGENLVGQRIAIQRDHSII